jgi:type IV pilus assembly protein PilW
MKKYLQGFSLIELMIAITLGLVLLLGVTQVFLSSKTVYNSQSTMSRVQETGRLAIDFLSKDIRMAGYMGCSSRASTEKITNTLKNATTYKYNYAEGIRGYTNSSFPTGILTHAPAANTDVIVVRGVASSGVTVVKNNDSAQLFASLTSEEANACPDNSNRISGLCQGDILVVTDCAKARIFQTTNVTKSGSEVNVVHSNASYTPGNDISSWGGSTAEDTFGAGSEILKASTTTYFIHKNDTTNVLGLWQSVDGVETELLEGVEDMSISYGVDTSTDSYAVPSEYKSADTVTAAEWSKVVSVKLELLVASVGVNGLQEKQTATSTDKKLRQVFSSTIAIRNRGL